MGSRWRPFRQLGLHLEEAGFNEWVAGRSHAASERKTLPELSANMETGFFMVSCLNDV